MKQYADSEDVENFAARLRQEEKSPCTLEKYRRDVWAFLRFCRRQGRPLEKALALEYKEALRKRYKTASVNSMLAAMNQFLEFLGRGDCKVHAVKMQRRIFCDEREELSKQEYLRLLQAARRRHDQRLYLILQTLGGTGIRVSELRHITAQAVRASKAVVECKNKQRVILIPPGLQKQLRQYMRENGIESGPIFLSRSGRPLERTAVWRAMKRLCAEAKVEKLKVFPHNLRHLFARTYYRAQHDLVRLADLLGHSSVETTRIYLLTSSRECFQQLTGLGLTA